MGYIPGSLPSKKAVICMLLFLALCLVLSVIVLTRIVENRCLMMNRLLRKEITARKLRIGVKDENESGKAESGSTEKVKSAGVKNKDEEVEKMKSADMTSKDTEKMRSVDTKSKDTEKMRSADTKSKDTEEVKSVDTKSKDTEKMGSTGMANKEDKHTLEKGTQYEEDINTSNESKSCERGIQCCRQTEFVPISKLNIPKKNTFYRMGSLRRPCTDEEEERILKVLDICIEGIRNGTIAGDVLNRPAKKRTTG